MRLRLDWHYSVDLGSFPYSTDMAGVPAKAGIYVFLRVHGTTTEALYVGKATNLRTRIKQQLNNLTLMRAIQKASTGKRRLVFAVFMPKPGQQLANALPVCEKTLIRYFLARGDGLVNIHGAILHFHELDSQRRDLRSLIPSKTRMQIQ